MDDAGKCCVHAYVSGRVQGVWFRAFTRENARTHDVKGWAKNLADGRVELMLEGTAADVDRVLDAVRTGPPHAKVTDLLQQRVPCQGFTDFTTQ